MELALEDYRVRLLRVLGTVDTIQQANRRFIRCSGSVDRLNHVSRYPIQQHKELNFLFP